jgi:hypothetical protein
MEVQVQQSVEPIEGVDAINKRLVDLYGKDVAVSLPNYRIVWSSSQYEWRNNDPEGFEIYSDQGIYLRTEYGSKEVEKYPIHPDMWVLEVLRVKDRITESLLVDPERFSYEPIWVFGAGTSNPQPMWKGVDYLVRAHKFKENVVKKTDEDLLLEDLEKLAKEKEECLRWLQNENPVISAQIRAGEAVFTPSQHFGE